MSAVACPNCGHGLQLPTITPELLYFSSTGQSQMKPKLGALLPDGSYAMAFAGVIYAMPAEDWRHYQLMCQAAQSLDERLTKCAA